MKRLAVIILASTMIAGCGSAATESSAVSESVAESTSESVSVSESSEEPTPEPTETAAPTETPEPTEEPDPLDDMTTEQKNAVRSASDYLTWAGFSHDGLIGQLSSEYGDQYPEDVAEFAVKYLEDNGLVNWDDQAIKAAQSYIDNLYMSRIGVIQQLTSEADLFTQEQADKAVQYIEDNGLVDWNEQAVKSAQSYLEYDSFSRDGLLDQLTSEYGEGFTQEQAEYALNQIYDGEN